MFLILNSRAVNGLIKFFKYENNLIAFEKILNYTISCVLNVFRCVYDILILSDFVLAQSETLSAAKYERSIDAVYIDLEITEETPLLRKPTKEKATVHPLTNTTKYKNGICLRLMGIALLFIGGCGTGIYLLFHERRYLTGYALDLVSREAWSSMKNLKLDNVNNLNALHVLVMQTGGENCDQSAECLEILQTMEKSLQTGINFPYNFLIAGDGQTYEVLGWDYMTKFQLIAKDSLTIGFIGDYTNEMPTEEQFRSLISLIVESIRRQKLQPNYRLLGVRNKTISSLDGDKLYNEISKWEHFDTLLEIM